MNARQRKFLAHFKRTELNLLGRVRVNLALSRQRFYVDTAKNYGKLCAATQSLTPDECKLLLADRMARRRWMAEKIMEGKL